MKLLCVDAGHPYQCADQALIWSELGIEWYSTGYYSQFNGCGDLPRISTYYSNKSFREQLKKQGRTEYHGSEECTNVNVQKNKTYTGKSIPNMWKFSKDFIDQFDIIVVNHFIENIINNLDVFSNKKIIFNTFGMHNPNDEKKIGTLRALKKIIRVSNNELESLRTGLYGGNDYIIHGSVVPNEEIINNWNGSKNQVCTFSNAFNKNFELENRRRKFYIKIKDQCSRYKFLLYGACNDDEPLSGGFINFDEKLKIMQDSRVCLVTGTPNSSCTYSLVESMIMGVPTVCYGKNMWQSPIYEIDRLFNSGEDILIGNSTEECIDYIQLLMNDKDLCNYLSKNARKKAIEIYGRTNIANKWKELFNEIS